MSEKKQYKTQEFSVTFLQGVLWGETEGAKIVKDEIVGTGRWSVHHSLMFKYKDQLYATSYSVGATEQQDEGPWEYENGPIACTVVRPTPVVTIEYLAVPEGEATPVLLDEAQADALVEAFDSNGDLVCDMIVERYGDSENPAEKLYLAQILYDAANNY